MPTRKRTVTRTVYEHHQDNIARLQPGDYMAPARKGGRLPTPQEDRIRRWHRDGLTIERIAENSGARLETIYDLLGLDKNSPEFEKTQAKLQERKRV